VTGPRMPDVCLSLWIYG